MRASRLDALQCGHRRSPTPESKTHRGCSGRGRTYQDYDHLNRKGKSYPQGMQSFGCVQDHQAAAEKGFRSRPLNSHHRFTRSTLPLAGQDGRAFTDLRKWGPLVQGRSPGRLPSPAQRAGFREGLPFRGNAPAICSRSVVQMIGALPL